MKTSRLIENEINYKYGIDTIKIYVDNKIKNIDETVKRGNYSKTFLI